MHLVIQIPCYNEEKTLPLVFKDLPIEIKGVDKISTLVINDGSTDNTAYYAHNLSKYVISNPTNKGLAFSFLAGLRTCSSIYADIIVNTDGDNQYDGKDIEKLIRPILDGQADMVIGCRDIYHNKENPWFKKVCYWIGSKVVGMISGVNIPDPTSGFRAMKVEIADRLHLRSKFSYTIESLIRIAEMGYRIKCVSIKTNPKTRPSRLFKSYHQFIWKQGKVIGWAIMHKLKRGLRCG